MGKKFDGNPRYWTVHDGRLYPNLDADIARQLAEDVAGNVAKADKQWRRVDRVGPKGGQRGAQRPSVM